MAEYIDRDRLFWAFEKESWFNNADRDDVAEPLLLSAPAADVAPVVHGEWVVCGDGDNVPWMCSHCGKTTAHKYKVMYGKYCPNCGARMDGE